MSFTLKKGFVKINSTGNGVIYPINTKYFNLVAGNLGTEQPEQICFKLAQSKVFNLDELETLDAKLNEPLNVTGTANSTQPYILVIWNDNNK